MQEAHEAQEVQGATQTTIESMPMQMLEVQEVQKATHPTMVSMPLHPRPPMQLSQAVL